MNSLPIAEFLKLRDSLPLVDVRSESEFQLGHIPKAINIALLKNEERVIVGTAYKKSGQKKAIKEGFRLVGPRLLSIVEETEKLTNSDDLLVYCWRGGMRSQNFCRFMKIAKINSHSLSGGYKSYRQVIMDTFRLPFKIILLGGCTGSGKTEILNALAKAGEQVLDLEGIANHKGSAFGGLMMPPQPTTQQFQNNMFEEIQKFDFSKRIWVEDECLAIGKIFLPTSFWKTMTQSPLVTMEVAKSIRIERLVKEYGGANANEFVTMMQKVVNKLGGQNFIIAKEKFLNGDIAATMEILLTYYDKAYLRSMENKKDRTLFSLPWDGTNGADFANVLISKLDRNNGL